MSWEIRFARSALAVKLRSGAVGPCLNREWQSDRGSQAVRLPSADFSVLI
jgi:hypothetical protein